MSSNSVYRDLYMLDDESNPLGSSGTKIYPPTVLDQVFDDQDPSLKNLRTILEELKELINRGGDLVINFPVTSVNGQQGKVIITKESLGLGNVTNTSDTDKPLSDVQRRTIMEILDNYRFDIDLHRLDDHIADANNPHNVNFKQINASGEVTELIRHLINDHNLNASAHNDIRSELNRTNQSLNESSRTLGRNIQALSDILHTHSNDENAHSAIMNKKEDSHRKVAEITDGNTNYDNYPSTRAMVKYIAKVIAEYAESKDAKGIEDITIVSDRAHLGTATKHNFNHATFIIKGAEGTLELAICRLQNNQYYWDITDTYIPTQFNQDFFTYDKDEGLSINTSIFAEKVFDDAEFVTMLYKMVKNFDTYLLSNFIIDDNGDLILEYADHAGTPDIFIEDGYLILNNDGEIIDEDLAKIKTSIEDGYLLLDVDGGADEYYTKAEIDNKGFITSINIVKGTVNGTIRYYVNGDLTTMSEDIRIAGLRNLAYKDKVDEDDLAENSISSAHIRNKAVTHDKLDKKAVDVSNMTTGFMTVIGNVSDDENRTAEEIKIDRLAELFAPVFRDILEGTDLIQLTEGAVRNIVKEELRKRDKSWIDPSIVVNFIAEGSNLILEYDSDFGTPNLSIENGELILEYDEQDMRQVDKDLIKCSFNIGGDELLWLKITN